ncbi:hypothetical protein WA158_002869 [Blastocystis sp. Blastoise]
MADNTVENSVDVLDKTFASMTCKGRSVSKVKKDNNKKFIQHEKLQYRLLETGAEVMIFTERVTANVIQFVKTFDYQTTYDKINDYLCSFFEKDDENDNDSDSDEETIIIKKPLTEFDSDIDSSPSDSDKENDEDADTDYLPDNPKYKKIKDQLNSLAAKINQMQQLANHCNEISKNTPNIATTEIPAVMKNPLESAQQ